MSKKSVYREILTEEQIDLLGDHYITFKVLQEKTFQEFVEENIAKFRRRDDQWQRI